MGTEEAWERHCADKKLLKNYSNTMHQLASTFWDINNKNLITTCRITWISNYTLKYFIDDFLQELEREKSLAKNFCIDWNSEIGSIPISPYTLLDVGSCYNPFQNNLSFKVFPIDIAPAIANVVKCDFLSVKLGPKLIISQNTCNELPLSKFDIVVFSFLLEYFPTSKQRYLCCKKAYDVLKSGGILVIATPDSNHESYNSKLMKNWKFALSSLGFWRIKYEKLTHMHCMIFRKCKIKQIPLSWLNLMCKNSSNFENLITIPQDSKNNLNFNKRVKTTEIRPDNEDIASLFDELVHINDK
ncbi:S-adenosylmethionine sensor upstream of mTORC1 isoform X2 [Daktulosphaira vitifoliae]|nr:S-adenosylmethionine sensor upstream of mTORC1 isoform X2 [Daktulosphaira vitifoliae]